MVKSPLHSETGPSPVFDRLSSMPELRGAFEHVLSNGGSAGGDGITVGQFAQKAEHWLLALNHNLRHNLYRPGPVRIVQIPKENSYEKRILRIPCVIDRIVQSSAHFALRDILEPEFEDVSYAYRPGRSIDMAEQRINRVAQRGFGWVVDGDIRAYFDRVPHKLLQTLLRHHVDEVPFNDLIEKWLAMSGHPGMGIAQGAPISPILANLYLDGVDEALVKGGFSLIRYADDFIILCRSQKRAEKALALISKELASLHLELHPEKTCIREFDRGFEFLGRWFGGHRSALSRQVSELGEIPGGRELEGSHVLASGKMALEKTETLAGNSAAPASRFFAGKDFEDRIAQKIPPAYISQPWLLENDTEETSGLPKKGDGDSSPEEKSRLAEIIRPLYVRTPGRIVDCVDGALCIMERGTMLAVISPVQIDRIDIFPGADITTDAMRWAMANNISVNLVDGHGVTEGTMQARNAPQSRLHLAQSGHIHDKDRQLALARKIVYGRIYNQRKLLQRLKYRMSAKARKDEQTARLVRTLDKIIKQLDHIMRKVKLSPAITTVSEAMGHEGHAAKLYWPALASCLKKGWSFPAFKRRRRPPLDAFNSLLNWTAHLLRRDLELLILRHGLHPGFGILHGTDNQRPACVFDLIEEFRAPVAEALAVTLMSTRKLRPEHFDRYSIKEEEKETIWLVRPGPEIVIRAYERWLDNEVSSAQGDHKTTWRGIMEEQIIALKRHFRGEEEYTPFLLYHKGKKQ